MNYFEHIFVIDLNSYTKGLTGFDSRCEDRARMQAGVCTALNNSCKDNWRNSLRHGCLI